MSEKELHIPDLSDQILDSLRGAFLKLQDSRVEECDMADRAIALALGDLNAQEAAKTERHIQDCNYCLNLVLDARMATEPNDEPDLSVEVLPGLAKAINRPATEPKTPSFSETLRSAVLKSWELVKSPRLIVTFATACLAFVVINVVLQDPEIPKEIGTVYSKRAPKQVVRKESGSLESRGGDVRSATNHQDSSYPNEIDTSKPDPFEPIFIQDRNETTTVQSKRVPEQVFSQRKMRVPRTPLEKIDLDHLKLVGIVVSEKGNKAIVEDSSGKGYVITVGTYIGTNSGKVTEIDTDKVIIEEEDEDVLGKVALRKIELRPIRSNTE